jgi:hypothetical protein
MKTWGSGGIAPPFLGSGLYVGEWLASRLYRFIPRERDSGSHWIGSWMSLSVGMNAAEKREMLKCRESNPTTVSVLTLI